MKKTILYALSLFFVLTGLSVTVNASTSNQEEYYKVCIDSHEHDVETESEEVDPIALTCDCGGSYNSQRTSYTPWMYTTPTRCPKNNAYLHNNERRTQTIVYKCGKCSSQYSSSRNQVNPNCNYGSGCPIYFE